MCYAGDAPPVAECANCGQPFCEAHRGIEPRPEWCAECVANAKVEESLGWSTSGCTLGLILGVVIWLLLLLVFPPLAQGPGRGFVIVLLTSLVTSGALYVVRRSQLR